MPNAGEHGRFRYRRLRACRECDLIVALPPLKIGESADCPRCRHTLVQRIPHSFQRVQGASLGALILFVFSLPFPFVSLETQGIEQQIVISQVANALYYDNEILLALVVSLGILILPVLFLLSTCYLSFAILRGGIRPWHLPLARLVMHFQPWIMADVFLIGVLVSLTKVSSLADISVGPSFWAFCGFVLLLLYTLANLDRDRFWFAIAGEPRPPGKVKVGHNAREQGLTSCAICDYLIDHAVQDHCSRCGEHSALHDPINLQKTWALILTAAVLYIPANVLPIMYTTSFGASTPQTIAGGILHLAETGSLPIAIVIFIASIVIPIAKLITLGWLCLIARRRELLAPSTQMRLYRVTHFIGRWSMIDVFVVGTLSALIQAGFIMSVEPGPGILPFAAVVIITMVAAMQFDTRNLWLTASRKEAPA